MGVVCQNDKFQKMEFLNIPCLNDMQKAKIATYLRNGDIIRQIASELNVNKNRYCELNERFMNMDVSEINLSSRPRISTAAELN